MKFIIAVTTLFASLAAAAPTEQNLKARSSPAVVDLKFWAAGDNTYSIEVKANGKKYYIGSNLSFSSISSSSSGNTECHAHGEDGSDTVLYGSEQNVDIGPPQVQEYVICT